MNRLEYLAHHGEPEQIIKEVTEAISILDERCGEKVSEVYRLRGEMLAVETRVRELEAALKRIQENSLECDKCSASLFAEQALKITKGR
jgi:hypothetical protein